jgi:hypothetical protein
MRISIMLALVMLCAGAVMAQEDSRKEQRAPLGQAAIALDAKGAAALEASLRTSALNGAPDAPVTNVRIVIKNVSSSFLTYVSGVVTFYDGAGVRCGEAASKSIRLRQASRRKLMPPECEWSARRRRGVWWRMISWLAAVDRTPPSKLRRRQI